MFSSSRGGDLKTFSSSRRGTRDVARTGRGGGGFKPCKCKSRGQSVG